MSLVSIVVPTYNRSKLLKECVKSLLAQTYSDLEIIIVDDGSTDDTSESIRTITNKHPGVKYYSRPHLGSCATRNFGLDQAKGEYIGFFDSDDLWPPNYIETMVKTLNTRPDFGAAYSRLMLFGDGEIYRQFGGVVKFPSGNLTTYLFSRKPYVVPSAVIFRGDVWNKIRWDESLKATNEDLEVFLRISTRIKLIYVPDVYALHRAHIGNITAMSTKDLFNDGPWIMERFYFQLGGSSYVPKRYAFRQISHRYRRFALRNYRAGNGSASITIIKRALSYCPFDLRLYVDFLRAFFLIAKADRMPGWRIPEPLTIKFVSPKHHSTKEKKSEVA